MGAIVLLGPQRYRPTLGEVLDEAGVRGPLVSITAGWEEREGEVAEMATSIRRGVHDLGLHRALDDALAADPAFLAAWRARRLQLRTLRVAYRLRLEHLVAAGEALERLNGDEGVLQGERADHHDLVRLLDDRHVAAVEAAEAAFARRWHAGVLPVSARRREEMLERIGEAEAVLVAGGHVGVLMHRLAFFGLRDALAAKPVYAWSAGAMAATERVVLFHDRTPQGDQHIEVLGAGLSLADGLVVFPHAHRRLETQSPARMAQLARRVAPRGAVLLDDGEGLALVDGVWRRVAGGARRVLPDGSLHAVRAA